MRNFLINVLLLTILQPAISVANPYQAIYVFGDSLSDTGRIYQLSGGSLPASPPYYQGRFSNGSIWVEYLAEQLQLTYDANTNFAWGGAETGTSFLPQGLKTQVNNYLRSNPQADPTGLYLVGAGSNDFFVFGNDATEANIQTTVDNVISVVTQLHEAGAQFIAVLNVPDLGLTPSGQTQNTDGTLTNIIAQYNASLYARLNQLNYSVAYIDAFSTLRNLVTTPALLNLENVTEPCLQTTPTQQICDNPNSYLFWDDKHPTTVVHQNIATQTYQLIQQAEYLPETGNLQLPVVTVTDAQGNTSTFQAVLQQQTSPEWHFAVTQLTTTAVQTGLAPASIYHAETGDLEIPRVYVGTQACQVTLSLTADTTQLLFYLKTVSCD
ncbi:phospholipase/lecithinase/hemolysin [Beggiatoa alba B18LD]|uniref:Phospholipase/lecithinase/hemolysin n=1 Tax=Beggiatoa alba B18LD TaxID=395493 RepID=I3CCL1_9GAMM|nr:SGNH/GDSL hydrolase family protein [Beggiatoa alba]EIJ41354.1 phospholipase/lecithinase/hemolysin [Beggiatoa alba B18LD]